MKKVFFALVSFLTAVLFSACGPKGVKQTASDIESKYGQSVVLVQNEYYYSAKVGNATYYFSGINAEGEIENGTFDEAEIKKSVGYGTGFFVDDKGQIVTNNHVAQPAIDSKIVKDGFDGVFRVLEKAVVDVISEYNDRINQLDMMWRSAPYGSFEEAQIENEREQVKEKRSEANGVLTNLRHFNSNDIVVTLHSRIGIAYNNTFITQESDFLECVNTLNDAEHDLSVIQLKNKKTPEECTPVDVTKKGEDSETPTVDEAGEYLDVDNVPLGSKLYLVGYNLGPQLALTKDGVKAQITEGSLSQSTDNVKMMYTIPTLPGSSGSPVFDEYGNFVAVNFAGINITQNFNYGIKAKHLRKLLGYE